MWSLSARQGVAPTPAGVPARQRQQHAARASRGRASRGAPLVLSASLSSPEDVAQAAQFKPLPGVGNSRMLGVEIQVPRLEADPAHQGVASPFCTFSACALPTTPRLGPRTALNLHHAFVSDDDRVLLKSISYGNATSAGAEDCDADCNFTPRWCALPSTLPSAASLASITQLEVAYRPACPTWLNCLPLCGWLAAARWQRRRVTVTPRAADCVCALCASVTTRCIRAGPRADIYFKPEEVKAAIVTCGGLCPGLNDVIRQIVITLEVGYGVDDIVGIPFGYRGFFEPGLEVRRWWRPVARCANG